MSGVAALWPTLHALIICKGTLFFEEKDNNPNKIRHDVSFELSSKDSYPRFNYTPTTLECQNDRKKSESNFLRSSLKEGYSLRHRMKMGTTNKEEKAIA